MTKYLLKKVLKSSEFLLLKLTKCVTHKQNSQNDCLWHLHHSVLLMGFLLHSDYVEFMLWSQIKLTSYDFSDLHITGEFDNRPGTGLFLSIFSCVVTYRTGAGRRLYIKTSADARPGTVRCRTVPGWRCKRSAGHRTVPGRFYTNFSRAMMNTFISKFAIILANKQVV